MKRLRNPPPRPIVLWAATVFVALNGIGTAVAFGLLAEKVDASPGLVLFGVLPLTVVTAAVACQWVAVLRRHWMSSWMAAAFAGFVFVVPGAFCFFSSPLAMVSMMRTGPTPLWWTVPATGVWSALATATGALMLWWAVRLYRWRVLKVRPYVAPVEDDV